jgi:hypothetical protein
MIYKLITEKGKPSVLLTKRTESEEWAREELSNEELLEFMKRVFRQEITQQGDIYVEVGDGDAFR